MLRTWENALSKLNDISSPAEKLQFILKDIWDENGTSGEFSRINLFVGRVFTRGNNAFIHDILTLTGEELAENPYAGTLDRRELTVFIGPSQSFYEEQKVVFMVCLGALGRYSELIKAKKVKTFEQLGIDSFDHVIDGLLNNAYAPNYRDLLQAYQIHQKWPEEFETFRKHLQTVSELQEQIGKLESEITSLEKTHADTMDAVKVAQEDADRMKKETAQAHEANTAVNKELNEMREQLRALRQQYRSWFPQTFDTDYLNWTCLDVSSDGALKTISSRLKYKYQPEKIVSFIMALYTSQIIAICGDPGTGKTTFARQMAEALGAKFHLIEVQNNWTDRSDILGFFNPTKGTYQSTAFLDALIEARDEEEYCNEHGVKSRLHIICLDEMNLARVEYYFATFLSLLQQKPDERVINLLPWEVTHKSDETNPETQTSLLRYNHLYIPTNVRFVGTMNMDDTAQHLSPKVIDRCIFIEFESVTSDDDDNAEAHMAEAYYPACDFGEIWDPEKDNSINQVFFQISADQSKGEHGFIAGRRLIKYANCMWPAYSRLMPEHTLTDFIDLLLCSKVLPSITSIAATQKFKSQYEMTKRRIESGQERGKLLHPYDIDSWSYWE